MFRFLAKLALIIVATLILVGVSSALASVPLKERAAGVITSVVPGHLEYAGQGQATHFGNYAVLGSADFDNFGNILNGQDTIIAADGSTVTGSYAGNYTPLPTGQLRFDVTVHWISGTGRFAGVTGQSDIVAVVDGVAPGAAFRYVGLGNLVIP